MDLVGSLGQPTFRVTQERSPYSNRSGLEDAFNDIDELEDELSETEELLSSDEEDEPQLAEMNLLPLHPAMDPISISHADGHWEEQQK